MSIIADILTGKLFRFKTATGPDVDAGVTDKKIVTPVSILASSFLSERTSVLHFPSASDVNTSSTNFQPGAIYNLTSSTGNHYFLTNRQNSFTAKFFAYVKADSGAAGEICLWDIGASAIVTGSTIAFNNTGFSILASGEFSIQANKVYTYAIRKTSGGLLTNVSFRTALVTFKIPKN
jgi:hypothetical protein